MDIMPDGPTRDEFAATNDAMEARADTKFAQLLGEMRVGFAGINARIESVATRLNARIDGLSSRVDGLSSRIDGVERTTGGTKTTVIATGIGSVALVIAALAYGQTWFGIGIGTRDVVRTTITEYLEQHPALPK